jgi:hypothetical protein
MRHGVLTLMQVENYGHISDLEKEPNQPEHADISGFKVMKRGEDFSREIDGRSADNLRAQTSVCGL